MSKRQPPRPMRRAEKDFFAALKKYAEKPRPQYILMHPDDAKELGVVGKIVDLRRL